MLSIASSHAASSTIDGTRLDGSHRAVRLVVLVPAYNEEDSIEATLDALLVQSRMPDLVVVIPNGCTDRTAERARAYPHPVEVFELPRLEHKKSQALNMAWLRYAQDADVVVCLDADTVLARGALRGWDKEMRTTPGLGGSSSKFTMLGDDVMTRVQRFEFARWSYTSLARGWTSVLAGTGCAIRNDALHAVHESHLAQELEIVLPAVTAEGVAALLPDPPPLDHATAPSGPWSYDSQVEDFFLTYEIRRLGWYCHVSPTVRAYTDSMKDLRSLWNQRMKWQVGTVEDLVAVGFNRLTALDWWQQALGLVTALVRFFWIFFICALALTDQLVFSWVWWVVPPLIFIVGDFKASLLIPHRDWRDVALAALLLPQEVFAWLRAGWFLAAWREVIWRSVTSSARKDRWALQHAAEGTSD